MMKRRRGFTLIEMLVALAIGAGISLMAYQALSGSIQIEQRVNTLSQKTNNIQRVWEYFADDLQHAVARPWTDNLGSAQPAMLGLLGDRQSQSSGASLGEDSHLLRFVRSGENNFLQQPRSNLQLAAYRMTIDDGVEAEEGNISLWRDYWRPIDSASEPKIKSRRLMENIKSISFRYLSRNSKSTEDQAWITGWPESTAQSDQLPIAVEVTIDIVGMGEVMRLFSLIHTDG
jgi:type II secretion system protein J